VVSDLAFTPEDAALAIRSALEQTNFIKYMDPEDVTAVIRDALELADKYAVGTVLERRLEDIRPRS
jgi:hypothetical protein